MSSDRLSEIQELLHGWLTKRTTTKSALQSVNLVQLVIILRLYKKNAIKKYGDQQARFCTTWMAIIATIRPKVLIKSPYVIRKVNYNLLKIIATLKY